MEIIIAKNSGLCYGVKRALKIAKDTRRLRKGKVSTLGDLIHNPRVIADLKKEGILPAEGPENIDRGTVIIRSHGVSPEIYHSLVEKDLEVIDATCPIVKKIQKLVESLAKKDRDIIIVGNREHPEIKGLIGYSHGKGIIIENDEQARLLPHKKQRAVLAQSTQDLSLFGKVVAALIEKTKKLEVYNTICHFTQSRQKNTSELASQVDTLFIVGGKTSSNTNKLYQISKKILPNTYFIEDADEISLHMLQGANLIGISGGASTPSETLREAVDKIKKIFKELTQWEKNLSCPK